VEFLVTMTTSVPPGTSDETIADVRQREAENSKRLVAQRSLFRLWRPPLAPGEWRTLGLFAAANADGLETVLASMPLRIWRTDEVEPLSPHSNDPALVGVGAGSEFLATMVVAVPDGTTEAAAQDRFGREAERARELADQGHLRRLWALDAPVAVHRTLGLWNASDPVELGTIVEALPLHPWMTVATTELSPHPSDPARLA
jgi:muconolactone delta-isomerase